MDTVDGNNISHLSPRESALCTARQQSIAGSQHVCMLGRVTIEMENHDPIHATQLVVTLQECLWLDESGDTVLRHTFKEALKSYHPWRHVGQHSSWTMAFDHDEMQGCVFLCSVKGHNLI